LDRVLPKEQGVPRKRFHFSLFTDAPLLGHYAWDPPTPPPPPPLGITLHLSVRGLGLMLFLTSFSLLIKEMVITDKGSCHHFHYLL
jgi:hypothetical protein